jgi:hypothetical protein
VDLVDQRALESMGGASTASLPPLDITKENPPRPRRFTIGATHACARMSDASVQCWGDNRHGEVGDGTRDPRTTPVAVGGLRGVVQVVAGLTHTCALLSDSTLRCWGDDSAGQLGDGATTDQPAPVKVQAVGDVVGVGLAPKATCARLKWESVVCWGGDFGPGITRVPELAGIVDLAMGGFEGDTFGCALRRDATVWCWGSGTYGELGDGARTSSKRPVRVSGLDGVASIDAGDGHVCAARKDGTVWCWGLGAHGELGVDASKLSKCGPEAAAQPCSPVPTMVPDVHAILELTVGGHTTCMRKRDGEARCVGAIALAPEKAIFEIQPGPSLVCLHASNAGIECGAPDDIGRETGTTPPERAAQAHVVW